VRNIINGVETLGIIGLSKNTGKTTTLNKIIEICQDMTLGLTSIGLDGESLDQVNFLPKPKIIVKPRMVIATASECLKSSVLEYETLLVTNMQTALGLVHIVKIKSEGTMVIAGPTTNHDLHELILMLKPYVDKILVDGAFNRMTFASIESLDAIVLATGAAYSIEMNKTVQQTKHIVKSFNLEKNNEIRTIPDESLIIRTDKKNLIFYEKNINVLNMLSFEFNEKIISMYIKGAVTEKMVDYFITHDLRDFILICDDPTKLLFKDQYFDYIEKLNIVIQVIHQTPLLFVTINPWSPIGHDYDEKLFLESIQKELDVPVYNVKKME
jgi:molybdopterin-guanine dinucleotide biosynthesis protein